MYINSHEQPAAAAQPEKSITHMSRHSSLCLPGNFTLGSAVVMNYDLGVARRGYFYETAVAGMTTNTEPCRNTFRHATKNDWSLGD